MIIKYLKPKTLKKRKKRRTCPIVNIIFNNVVIIKIITYHNINLIFELQMLISLCFYCISLNKNFYK